MQSIFFEHTRSSCLMDRRGSPRWPGTPGAAPPSPPAQRVSPRVLRLRAYHIASFAAPSVREVDDGGGTDDGAVRVTVESSATLQQVRALAARSPFCTAPV